MNVPREFQPIIRVEYPKDNFQIFEQWLISNPLPETNRKYLPVNWCGYFVNNNYGNNKNAMASLQRFVNGLDRRQEMYTVTQYDLGILTSIDHLNIKVFGSGGGRIDVPIPLVCHPHGRQENKRDIFVSFIGSLTHSIRNEMIRKAEKITGSYISTEHHDVDKFCNVLSRSIFSLCPRGYGKTSFRICESLEQGSIPIYISDEFIFPEGIDAFKEYGVVINRDELENLDLILKSYTAEEIKYMQEAGRQVYKELYTFEGLRSWLIKQL